MWGLKCAVAADTCAEFRKGDRGACAEIVECAGSPGSFYAGDEVMVDPVHPVAFASKMPFTPRMNLLPRGPIEMSTPTYSDISIESLHGEPLHADNILLLTLGESLQELHLAIHSNGYALSLPKTANGELRCPLALPKRGLVPWSPFTMVEKCQVKGMSSNWAVFKVTVFNEEGANHSTYFANSGANAIRDRDIWMSVMKKAIINLSASLLPPHTILVDPVAKMPGTHTRIMAGYLLQAVRNGVIVIYCELHPHRSGGASFKIYKDEWCDHALNTIMLLDSTSVFSTAGFHCNIFGIDKYHFCARSRKEADLWLRAVSNIKVKLMFDAPEPTEEELEMFRSAVQEQLVELYPLTPETIGPLLMQAIRTPDISCVPGDTMNPAPIDDAAECSPDPVETSSCRSDATVRLDDVADEWRSKTLDDPTAGDVSAEREEVMPAIGPRPSSSCTPPKQLPVTPSNSEGDAAIRNQRFV